MSLIHRRARALVARLLRVSSVLFVMTLVLGALGARRAKADVARTALDVGEGLLTWAEDEGESRELVLNGQTVHIATAQTAQPVSAVLARFQAQCEDHADGMARDLRSLGSALDAPPTREGHPGIGVLRDDRDGRGVVACFATGAPTGPVELAHRLERLAASHDLADIGRFRYVAARKTDAGATLVVATWTEEPSFSLDAMFPARGDAAGDDPRAALRPENARRTLSARDARAPYGVFLYEMQAAPLEVLGAYRARMLATGFTDNAAAAERAPEARAFARPGVDVIVTATRHGDRTVMSVTEMPATAAAAAKATAARKGGRR